MSASTRTIALVGHKGRMGAMLAERWRGAGHIVRGVDRDARDDGSPPSLDPARLREAVDGADVAALCIPAQAFGQVLPLLAPMLAPHQILMDITSVKMEPMRRMEAAHRGPVVGTHPLFGPGTSRAEELKAAVTPGRNAREEHTALVEELFAAFGCRTFRSTAEEHDRAAAYVQGLNFVSAAAYFAALARREELLPFLTPSFRKRLEGARKLLTEDAPMFEGFIAANPMTRDAIHTFRLFLDLVESGGLAETVRHAGWWFEENREE